VTGRRPSDFAELTPTERRVAELASDGPSNKEIAEALSVCVHTLETHLPLVDQMLGIRSRAQLGTNPYEAS
jgi:DNA-binding NarL/FixJ family response regulator